MAYTPQMTSPDEGNLIATGTSIAAGGTSFSSVNMAIPNIYERRLYLTYNNSTATLGLKVQAFPRYGTSSVVNGDDSRIIDFTLPPNNGSRRTFVGALPPGNWNVKITNLDTSVAATIGLTSEDITSISPS